MKKNFYSALVATLVFAAVLVSSETTYSQVTITTGTITGSPFCICASISVPYTVTGTPSLGNVFTAQLSDAAGSFASPVSIGSIDTTGSGTIGAAIPCTAVVGGGYRIRVVGSNPNVSGSDNGVNIIIVNTSSVIATQPLDVSVCAQSDASFFVAATGANLSYKWQGSTDNGASWINLIDNATYSNTNTPNLTVKGVTSLMNGYKYRCVVAAAGGCVVASNSAALEVISTVTITTQPPAFTYVCNGGNTTICVTATGAGLTYQWQYSYGCGWADLANKDYYSSVLAPCLNLTAVSNLPPKNCQGTGGSGTELHYRLQIKSGSCTVASDVANLVINSPLPASVTISTLTPSICPGDAASFTANPFIGGTTPIYQWQVNATDVPGETNQTFTSVLSDGDKVTCSMTSNSTCVTTTTATSNEITISVKSSLVPTVSITSASNTICAGDCLTFTASPTNGGSSPKYQWKRNGITLIPGETNSIYTTCNLNNGDQITCSMTSSLSCASPASATSGFTTISVTANVPASVTISTSSPNFAVCAGSMLCFTATSVNGGTVPPPTYQWRRNNILLVGSNSSVYCVTAIQNGDYFTVTMTSSLTCVTGSPATSSAINITVMPIVPVSVFINASDTVICPGTKVNFTATSINGGLAPIYQWLINGIAVPGQGSPVFSSSILQNGDKVYCVFTSSIYCAIGNPATSAQITMTVNNTVSLAETHQDATCGNANGSIDLTVNGGNTPYTYNWGFGSTDEDLTNLSQGAYSVTVFNSGNTCYGTKGIIINNADGPSITETHTDAHCGHPDGALDITVSGGTSPYTFNWSNNAVTEDLSNIPAGGYTLTVTDQNGCPGNAVVTVSDINGPVITVHQFSAGCGSPGSAYITVTGGTSPYTYEWFNGATIDSVYNLSAGTYSVSVTDANGCLTEKPFTINQYNANGYYVYISGVSPNCSNSDGSLTAYAYGGSAPYTYLWSNTETTQTITGLSAGTYTITVTESGGCLTIGNFALAASCFNLIKGIVFNDTNGNCVFDSGETAAANISVTALKGGSGTYYGYAGSNGEYTIKVPSSGTYTLKVSNGYNQQCALYTTCGAGSVAFPSVGDTSFNNNFAFNINTGYNLTLGFSIGGANPGFTKNYTIYYRNLSSAPYNGAATITFKYDENLIYQSSTPSAAHDVTAHTLTWAVNDVAYSGWYNNVKASFMVPVSMPTNFILKSDFRIDPTIGDCDSTNNKFHIENRVTGSYDPNEKEVFPSGNITEQDSVLRYTIHFQNTGNDTTHFIIVRDTLSSLLEPASVRNIASSHEYSEFNVTDQGTLTWIFNPIYLPDSATNPSASKGFVMFDIKKKGNLPIGTVIKNNASIYFDYNNPIVTNTVQNTISFPTGVKTHSAGNEISVSVFPNPFSSTTELVVSGVNGEFDFALYNVLGKKVKEMKHISSKQFTLNRNDLEQGIYFFSIIEISREMVNGKIIIE